MKKLLLSSLFFIGSLSLASAYEAPYLCDFSDGGADFTCYDMDGGEPNTSAQKKGFPLTDASWIFGTVDKEYVAMSNSTHTKTSVAAEDWLISPAITLTADNVLNFKAFTVSYGAAVRVATIDAKLSTTGVAVEDFTIDLFEKVNVTDDMYGADLSAYAGQTVHIAIINKSRSKDMLVIDDFFVGNLPLATVQPRYVKKQENASAGQRIAVDLIAGFSDPVTSFVATLTCGDFSTTHAQDGLSLLPGETYSFQFDEALPAPTPGEGQYFEVSVLVNGEGTCVGDGEIITQAYQPTKRIVCEEQTGTWCQWCPRGHVYMELMDEKYPDTYIGIASHINDIMQNYDYATYLDAALKANGGAPLGRVQRDNSSKCDPMDFPAKYNDYINTPAWADIAIEAEWKDDTKQEIILAAHTTFALTARNFATRLEFIVVEDDVHQPNNPLYKQQNAFAGGGKGQMGGYESKTNPVPADEMYYDDVVRYTITSDELGEGIYGSVPTAVEKGVTYTYWATMPVPTNIFEIENCEFIVLLLDFETGIVLNAAKCGTINDPTSVEDVCQENATRAYATATGVRVEVNADALAEVNVYAADGRLVYAAAPRRVAGRSLIDCPIEGQGVYLVNVVCDGVAKTHKVVL